MNNKCPCEECLVLAMCKGNKIIRLILKCDLLLYYIQNTDYAIRVIKTIKPRYYHRPDVVIARNAHQIIIKADELKYSRDKSYKRRIWQNV